MLSFLVPGTGQFVNGQRWKGILFVGLDLVCIVLKNTVSTLPIILLYLVVLIDVVIVGVQMIRGKRKVPSGRSYIIEIVIAFVIAAVVTWVVDDLTKQSLSLPIGKNEGLSTEEKEKVKKEAEAYLKNKYGKEFYVDQIEYIWQTGSYSMKGHLKNDDGYDFLVKKDDGQFIDSYFFHKLSKEGKKEIEPQIEGAFSPLMNWNTSVSVDQEVEDQFAKQSPSFQELRKQTQKYHQQIQVNVPISLTANNKTRELERAYELVSFLNQNEIRSSLEVWYYDPEIKEQGVTKIDFTQSLKYDKFLTAGLEVDDVSDIQSAEDLEQYLEIYD
ncbi:hypothetical protein CHM34_18255 [Paludifilum halophilum]|uniref:Uncharacterized protein n=1 Tax=Paludifilum halophilum TaxID=1642702 RepID=A0A235B1C4_9BACL|nr:hypothetical protein CHM34_18255 [Paludifilum halophilum]